MEIVILLISVLTLLVAIIAAYPTLRLYFDRQKINKFSGHIGDIEDFKKDTSSFTKFIFGNEGKIVSIDICFVDDIDYQIDEDGFFTFSYYDNPQEPHLGGYYYRIQVSKEDDFFFDNRQSSRRLKGYFKIIGTLGSNQGWFTAIMKPANINSL